MQIPIIHVLWYLFFISPELILGWTNTTMTVYDIDPGAVLTLILTLTLMLTRPYLFHPIVQCLLGEITD